MFGNIHMRNMGREFTKTVEKKHSPFQRKATPGAFSLHNPVKGGMTKYRHNFSGDGEMNVPPALNLHQTEQNMQGMGAISPMPEAVRLPAYFMSHKPNPVIGVPSMAPIMPVHGSSSVATGNTMRTALQKRDVGDNEAIEILRRLQEKVGAGYKLSGRENAFVRHMANAARAGMR